LRGGNRRGIGPALSHEKNYGTLEKRCFVRNAIRNFAALIIVSGFPRSRAATVFPAQTANIAQRESVPSIRLQQETTMNARTACLLLVLSTAAHAQSADTGIVKLPQDITYKGLPGAPQHVTLFGDSSQPGLYVDRIRFLPGMKVMPHWHPDTVRTVLVMSGTLYFAVGEQWDESKLKAYPAGTLYSEPAKTPHFAWAKDGEVILQVTAIGPTGNTPIPQKQ
jgi:quercetin dioxygenase-like cupin family protein